MKHIDTRGLSCPEPAVKARRAASELSTGDHLEILVDTGAARDNVLRTVNSLGFEAEATEYEGGFRLIVTKK